MVRDILENQVDKKYTLSDKLWVYLQNYAAKHREAGNGFGYGLAPLDFDEIKEIGASEEYVFVFDAVNEISDTEQIILLDKIKEIITIHGVRVVLTYRNHDVSAAFLSLIQEMSGFQYEFPGVSFESALEWLQKLPVADVSEYIDVLYSNNPFLLSKLKDILQKDMSEDAARNNISRYTYMKFSSQNSVRGKSVEGRAFLFLGTSIPTQIMQLVRKLLIKIYER